MFGVISPQQTRSARSHGHPASQCGLDCAAEPRRPRKREIVVGREIAAANLLQCARMAMRCKSGEVGLQVRKRPGWGNRQSGSDHSGAKCRASMR